MKCTIDTREQEAINRILDYYNNNKADYPNIEEIEVAELSTGDFKTNDNYFGSERKSIHDLMESMQKGRLKQQLYELRQVYKVPMLLVEDYDGMMDCILKNPQYHPNVIKGLVTSALAHNGVHIQFVNGFYVEFLLDTVNKLYDGKRELYENFGYTSIRTRSTSKEDFQKYFVFGLCRVGPKVGYSLLSAFDNSITNIVNASVEELQQVKGISEENAKHIKSLFK